MDEPARTQRGLATAKGDRRPAWRPLVRWAAFLALLAIVGRALVSQFIHLPWAQLKLDVGMLVLAFLAVIASRVLSASNYRTYLKGFGQRCGWGPSMAAAWISQLGKYIPGKVAAVAGAVWVLSRFGVPAGVAATVVFLSTGLIVAIGLVLAVPLTLWQPVYKALPLAWLWCTLLVAAGLACMHPRVLGPAANAILRRLRRPPIRMPSGLRYYLLPLANITMQWVLLGGAMWLLARSMTGVAFSQAPLFISVCALAQTAGFLALFAPAGLGVREGVLLLILGPILGEGPASLVVVLLRLVQTVVEVALGNVGFLILPKAPARKEGNVED